jgi:hypothetical protein
MYGTMMGNTCVFCWLGNELSDQVTEVGFSVTVAMATREDGTR